MSPQRREESIDEPKSRKDKWLMALVDRAGYGKVAVALANKNVRTAWAMHRP
jgi:transposase